MAANKNPDDMTMDKVKQLCPSFKKGTACPYKDLKLEGLAKGCPTFKKGCPFKEVKTVADFKIKLGELRDQCKGKENYVKAFDLINKANLETVAVLGHCPFMNPCLLMTDMNGKPILNPDDMTMDKVKQLCPAFKKGTACPYKDLKLEGLAKGCPAFTKGCPFKEVKTVAEFKIKLGELRDQCKGKKNYVKAFDLITKANLETVAVLGHCPFMNPCLLKTDMNGKPILGPNDLTMDTIKLMCPSFKKGAACPYKDIDMKGLGEGCPSFKNGCPFKDVENIGDFKAKMGEMRDECKGKENYTKVYEQIYKANTDGAAAIGHCPFNKSCQLKTDLKGKPLA